MLGIGVLIPILSLMSEQGENKFFDAEKFMSFFPFVNISQHRDMIFFSLQLFENYEEV